MCLIIFILHVHVHVFAPECKNAFEVQILRLFQVGQASYTPTPRSFLPFKLYSLHCLLQFLLKPCPTAISNRKPKMFNFSQLQVYSTALFQGLFKANNVYSKQYLHSYMSPSKVLTSTFRWVFQFDNLFLFFMFLFLFLPILLFALILFIFF